MTVAPQEAVATTNSTTQPRESQPRESVRKVVAVDDGEKSAPQKVNY
jgi:hypothetical protein